MDAFLLAIGIFLFWLCIGNATVALFELRLPPFQLMLLAPSMGIAVSIIPVFFLSRSGLPVSEFGFWLFVGLLLSSVFILAWRRPPLPVKRVLTAGAVILTGAALFAWPMFLYGLDWISFANDDMANYSLGAQRFLNNGFSDSPNLQAIIDGTDYSQAYWFLHVAGGVRAGSDLMLAAIWATTGINPHFAFMPIIAALHMSLIASVGAMAVRDEGSAKAPLLAMGLIAISPLATLGALYQLIAQVGGLALLGSSITLSFRPIEHINSLRAILSAGPAALMFTGLLLWYPELLPFFGMGWIAYIGSLLLRDRKRFCLTIGNAIVIGVICLFLVNSYAPVIVNFLLVQTSGGTISAAADTALFPYFLVPTGLPAFWGIIPIAVPIADPWQSIFIATGILLFAALFAIVIRKQAKTLEPPLILLGIMILVGVYLFVNSNDFGLFKLSMFAQGFLACVIASELAESKEGVHRIKMIFGSLGVVAALIGASVTQFGYVAKSTGEFYGGLTEIPHASSQKINRQFENFFSKIPNDAGKGYIADTTHIVMAKFQALYAKDKKLDIFSSRFFVNFILALKSYIIPGRIPIYDEEMLKFEKMAAKAYSRQIIMSGASANVFYKKNDIPPIDENTAFIKTNLKQTIFNSFINSAGKTAFSYSNDFENQLIFISSSLGNHYYFGDRNHIAYFQLEGDPLMPGEQISALGEHLVFCVPRPSVNPRMMIEMSATALKQYNSALPKPTVQNVTMGFVGRGSGRVVSDAIVPTMFDGLPCIALDLGRTPKSMQFPTTGLMGLYGRNVPQDSRRIGAFGRDISLISEAQYSSLTPPSSLTNFPADLANVSLEYSGIYEDGWISERAFFTLSPTSKSKYLVVKGMVPLIADKGYTSMLHIDIDGQQVAEQSVALGDFEIKVPVADLAGRKRIDLVFDNPQNLPNGDDRKTGGLIDFIGFAEE